MQRRVQPQADLQSLTPPLLGRSRIRSPRSPRSLNPPIMLLENLLRVAAAAVDDREHRRSGPADAHSRCARLYPGLPHRVVSGYQLLPCLLDDPVVHSRTDQCLCRLWRTQRLSGWRLQRLKPSCSGGTLAGSTDLAILCLALGQLHSWGRQAEAQIRRSLVS